jgi:hypothetical protein
MTWQAAAVTHDDGGFFSSLAEGVFAVCKCSLFIPCETLAWVLGVFGVLRLCWQMSGQVAVQVQFESD